MSIDTQQALDSFVLATKGREFLFIDPAQTAKYKATPEDMFGAKACQAFPSAVRDLQEALKCHALYRYSACAFHLMRVMELPVRAVWRSLKDNPTGVIANGWSSYTNEIEHEIEKREKEKPHPAEWQQRRSFYQAARNNLNSVYRAWRCPMMHLENLDKTYTLEQMEEIIVACRTLFRDIA